MRCEWEYDVSPTIPVACDQVQRSFEPLAAAADRGRVVAARDDDRAGVEQRP